MMQCNTISTGYLVGAYRIFVYMKSSYVYLNTYSNGYKYVGSHTWNGPPGVLDPDYHGSSYVAKAYGWQPVAEVILEVCESGTVTKREQYWIVKYLETFGIAPVWHQHCKSKTWAQQWSSGIMLNMHANDSGVINSPEVQTPEVRKRAAVARATPEARAKWRESMSAGGSKRFSDAGNSVEARKKAMETRSAFWSTDAGKQERSATCHKSAVTRYKDKPLWKCSTSLQCLALSTLCQELGYKKGTGPYDWWRHHGKPDKFVWHNIEFCKV